MSGTIPSSAGCICPPRTGAGNLTSKDITFASPRRQREQRGRASERISKVKNVTASEDTRLASHLISPDALALVRFGLRAADDPRIRDTAKVIDALLKVETPNGATWHRYNDDGYGEHEDGSPFDGTGIGRGWPCSPVSGHTTNWRPDARKRQTAPSRLGIIRQRKRIDFRASLGYTRHCGARTLLWPAFRFGHAAGLGACRISQTATLVARWRIFDLPPQTVKRYLKEKTVSPRLTWRFNHKIRSMPP